MAYFVLTGSTDPVTPARTFDLVDDEKLAVEMVRVLETLRPATWSTILPVVARAGMQVRSHSALVEQAQQEFDDRDDETRLQAEEVKAEALRRLGRGHEDDGQLSPGQDDDAPSAIDLEPRREREPAGQGFLARRRSKPQHDRRTQEQVDIELATVEVRARGFLAGRRSKRQRDRLAATQAEQDRLALTQAQQDQLALTQAQQDRLAMAEAVADLMQINEQENVPPVPAPLVAKARSPRSPVEKPHQPPDDRIDELQMPGSAELGAKGLPRRRRRHEADRSPTVDLDSVAAQAPVDRREPPEEPREPAAATADSDNSAETIVEPKPSRKRRESSPAPRPRRRAKRQKELAVEQVDTRADEDASPSEAASLFSERIAEYTLDHQRQSARERRSGRDRRSGVDRREGQIDGFAGPSDRRAGGERRSGGNRRRVSA